MLAKSTILVVDDDQEMSSILQDFLTRQGYAVTTAPSGAMALKLIQSLTHSSPDLIISDVIMDPINGIELTKHLLIEQPKINIVLMSSFGSGEVEKEALASGAKAYLHKPFQLSQMAKVVKEHLTKKAG